MAETGAISEAIDALSGGDGLSASSLIVTVFGDMARAPGAEIPGPVLSALTGRIGIRPEAMRVALHRLRKLDWIATRRAGRVSHYVLTATGRVQSEAVTARIYATDPPAPAAWGLVLADPALPTGGADPVEGALAVAPGAWLVPAEARLPAGLLAIRGEVAAMPDWLRERLMPAPLMVAYGTFARALAGAGAALPAGPLDGLAPLERAALRVLVVHGWRRLVLRHPRLPDGFFPDGWAGPEVRARVHDLLARLGRPGLDVIAADAQQSA